MQVRSSYSYFLHDMETLSKNSGRFFIMIIVFLTYLYTFIYALSSNGDKLRSVKKSTCGPSTSRDDDLLSPYSCSRQLKTLIYRVSQSRDQITFFQKIDLQTFECTPGGFVRTIFVFVVFWNISSFKVKGHFWNFPENRLV